MRVKHVLQNVSRTAMRMQLRTSLDGTTNAGKEAFLMDEPVC